MQNFSDHMFLMSGREVPASYLLSPSPPVISSLECSPAMWIRSVRGGELKNFFSTLSGKITFYLTKVPHWWSESEDPKK